MKTAYKQEISGNTLKEKRKGRILMTNLTGCVQYRIRLEPEEVNRFVNAASKCDFDVDISYNSFVVDAKSIVGVLGLDFCRPLTVVCHGYDSAFDHYLNDKQLV